jgi:hypothetical protein
VQALIETRERHPSCGVKKLLALLSQRHPDGARQDPISLIPLALGAQWGQVRPFVLRSTDQFRIPPPPALTSARYTRAFNEVKRLGGDGITTPTERTAELWPARSTVCDLLDRHGLVRKPRARRRVGHAGKPSNHPPDAHYGPRALQSPRFIASIQRFSSTNLTRHTAAGRIRYYSLGQEGRGSETKTQHCDCRRTPCVLCLRRVKEISELLLRRTRSPVCTPGRSR